MPLFLWLLKMHRDMVSVVIPRGFRLIRKELRIQGYEAKQRHRESFELMQAFGKAMGKKASAKAAPKTAQARSEPQKRPRSKKRPRK